MIFLLVGLLFFSFFNWTDVSVTIWDNLILDTKLPALVIIAFMLGFLPSWLLHRGTKWRLTRRIRSLENAAKAAAVTNHHGTDRTDHADRDAPLDESGDAGISASETALATDPATTTIRPVPER